MGTELLRVCVKEENDEIPSVPPGFESYTSFTLKRVQGHEKEDSENMISCSAFTSASESQPVHNMETEFHIGDGAKITRSLRRRPGINYGRFDDSSEDECDTEKLNQNFSLRPRLPKGVIRGCAECSNCQKVTSRWHPDAACRPILEDAPIFYPTVEEFEDTLKYIASIRPKAEPYGICRIVPPSSWKPPCLLKIKNIWETSKFATRVQRVDKLQNRDSIRKISRNHGNMRKKRRRCTRMGVDCESSSKNILGEAEWFGFEPGPEFTLDTFQKYADDFHAQYFRKNENVIDMGGKVTILQEHQKPSVEDIEGEYWRIVEKPTEEIEVLYGADLETGAFGSGFPKMPSQVDSSLDERYIKSGWNLNNFPRLPGSILSYESGDISGVLVPWLYIGMCFSSFCWHVEDHHLYSLNFLHWGAPKIWYGVPGKDALKLEEAMKKHLPDLFEEQPDLLHKLVTQLSPSILKSEGVPVYRCVQNPGEFVLTLPRAYHSGFNCGFNCAEAVNVAPVDWLPHGQIAIGLYSEQGRKTSISHDKLLLGAAREAVRAHWELNLLKKYTSENLRWKDICGQDGILAKALKARVEIERVRREFFSNSSRAVKMERNFDATTERECIICFFDLHLSAAGCHCSPDRYACLNHAKQFCSCASDTKFFLFRYDIGELNVLVEALEGKLSAVYRWAKLDLGLALSSYVSKDKLLHTNKFSHSPEPTILKQVSSQSSVNFLKDVYGKEISKYIPRNLSGFVGETSLPLDIKPSEAVLAMKDTNPSATFLRSLHEIDKVNNSSPYKKEESILLASKLGTPVCRLSQEDTSYGENLAAEQSELKKPSGAGQDDVILLSDDEVDEPKKLISDRAKDTSLSKHSDLSESPAGVANKASPYDYDKDPFLTTPVTDAAVLGEGNFSSLPDGGRTNCSSHSVSVKDEHDVKGGTLLGSNPPNLSCHVDEGSSDVELGINNRDFSITRDSSDHNMVITGTHQHPQSGGNGKPNNEERREKMGTITASNLADNERSIAGSPSYPQNNLDRYFRQKGPRIAKVVRRINCNVEALEFGVVLSGKLWCNSQAIFPKGFRSRVRYISVIEPTNMCYYVSEILDAGRDGPLFVVSLEHCPSEVFIHVSAARCWEMVRDRVNQEITKKHKLGIMNLPPLQPPGSLDGFEMFGFSSPAIVQAIEAMDRHRVCTEYWDSRPYSRPQVQIHRMPEEQNDRKSRGNHLAVGVDRILGGLLKKANPDELHSLYDILIDNRRMTDRSLLTRLLNEEINKRAK